MRNALKVGIGRGSNALNASAIKKREKALTFSENTYRMPKNVTISFINSITAFKYQRKWGDDDW